MNPERFPDPAVDPPGAQGRAVLAGGCFWCVEAVYDQLDGVSDVVSGYAGGTRETADYQSVLGGRTRHAEVVEVRFDPTKITFGALLKVFFSIAHDPTQRDRQGADVGPQYRSVIFWLDESQRAVAEAYIRQLDAAKVFDAPIVTELVPLEHFYEAEQYHQDYAARNPGNPYIAQVAAPKVAKLRAHLPDRLKS